ncbi:hypothetical protein MNBD_GAMMA25-2464 [hydrothermal vent metagenome]|uniref:Uncharacterized protein n=1 Tax=hydrothermal vent metagenome TaxID=652676 RepID=A0A3B1BWN8_9ZZZZ
MNMQIELLIQTLIMPLLLSYVVYRAAPHNTPWQGSGIFLAWLVACFWILKLPALPPAEAVDWLWLAGLSFVLMQYLPRVYRKATVLFIFVSSLLLISWPLLQYELTAGLVIELLFIIMAVAVFVISNSSTPSPGLIVSMSATALAVCTALSGSLLIAQLAAALAAATGMFALAELGQRLQSSQLSAVILLPLVLLYFLLLAIARFYAEMPVGSALLLLLAPLSLCFNHRLAAAACLLLLIAATGWIFMLQDSAVYY